MSAQVKTAVRSACCALASVALIACQGATLRLDPNGPDPWRARIGLAYGIEDFPRIETIQFTLKQRVATPEGQAVESERRWIHAPWTHQTWLVLPDDSIGAEFPAWPLDHLWGEAAVQLDDPWSELREQFLRDSEALFLPFALTLGARFELSDQGIAAAPASGAIARRIDVYLPDFERVDPRTARDSGLGTVPPLSVYLAESGWIQDVEWGPEHELRAVLSAPWPEQGLGFSLSQLRAGEPFSEIEDVFVRVR